MSEQPEMEAREVPPASPTTKPNGEVPAVDIDVTTPQTGIMERVVEGAVGRALSHADARAVYGDPITQGDRTVIPVARVTVNYGFGAGSGSTPDEKHVEIGSGGGGGGRVKTNAIGYIELTPDTARFVPIIDRSTIISSLVSLAGIVFFLALPRLVRGRGRR